MKLTLWGRE